MAVYLNAVVNSWPAMGRGQTGHIGYHTKLTTVCKVMSVLICRELYSK